MRRPLIAVAGATATGKTALARRLALEFGGEIVSADSRQVYRGMDIGTAKQNTAPIRQHLVDITEPDSPFSLGQWLQLAREALDDIWSRKRLPILAGGSGQYIWALLEGWRVPHMAPAPELRRYLEERLAREGIEPLARELSLRNPESAGHVDMRNSRRVIRALELLAATGQAAANRREKAPPDWDVLIIGLTLPRSEIYQRIDQRVDDMLAQGLEDEVRSLLAAGFDPALPSMSGIGYRQLCQHLAGEMDMPASVQRIKLETHRLVRHQNNWFKPGDQRIHWLQAGQDSQAFNLAADFTASLPEQVAAR